MEVSTGGVVVICAAMSLAVCIAWTEHHEMNQAQTEQHKPTVAQQAQAAFAPKSDASGNEAMIPVPLAPGVPQSPPPGGGGGPAKQPNDAVAQSINNMANSIQQLVAQIKDQPANPQRRVAGRPADFPPPPPANAYESPEEKAADAEFDDSVPDPRFRKRGFAPHTHIEYVQSEDPRQIRPIAMEVPD